MLFGWGATSFRRTTSYWSGRVRRPRHPGQPTCRECRRARGRLRRRSRKLRHQAQRHRLHQSSRVRPLGPFHRWSTTQPGRKPSLDRRRARVRQEVVGGRGQPGRPRHCPRAPGSLHGPDQHLRVPAGRDGRHLRRDHGLRRDGRPALPLDPAEAVPGFARHQRRPGSCLQRPGVRREDRPLPGPTAPTRPTPAGGRTGRAAPPPSTTAPRPP